MSEDPFEFDQAKSLTNQTKHGIDFQSARALWDDPYMLEVPARTTGEERFLVIGQIGTSYWSAVITYRQGRVRIISVRRSRKEEIDLYETL